MSSTGAIEYAPLDEAEYKHQARLLRALHCAYPVLFEGRERFVQVIHSRLAGGRVDMDLWLTGSSVGLKASQVEVPEKPK